MRKQLIFATIVTFCSFGMIDSVQTETTETTIADLQREKKEELCRIEEEKLLMELHHEEELQNFLNAIGHRESSNRYDIVNPWGYMGKYQFGRKTLNKLGFKHITNQQFLNSPEIQERAMKSLLKYNQKLLKRQIARYSNTVHNGVYVTESGLLAAAHLGGAGNVKKWLRKGYDFKDGYGTSIKEYLMLFGDYNIIL